MLSHFSWSSFKNLVKQAIPNKKIDSSKGIINWQTDGAKGNDFPQQLIQNVYNSPVGSAALKVWAEFVNGDGLLDQKAGNTVINEKTGLTLNDLNRLLSLDLTLMEGCSFIQRYTPDGKRSDVLHLPFEETRLGIPNKIGDIEKIFHNPYYGVKSFDDKDTTWFYDYNEDEEFVKKQIKQHTKEHVNKDGVIDPPYPGQAFWFSIEKPLARVYPQPFYYSAIKSFIVDDEIPSFHERNIKNNMLASVLINIHGDPSAPAGPAEAKLLADNGTLDQADTVGGVMDRNLKGFIEEKGGVLLNWFKKDEEKATFEAFPSNSHDQAFLNLQTSTTDHIAIGTQVPRILIGIGTAGKLGDTQELLNSITLMQGRTMSMRNILKRIYETKFGLKDGTIKNINPVNIIPDNAWAVLSEEEKRNYTEEHFNIELIEKEIVEPEVNSNVS